MTVSNSSPRQQFGIRFMSLARRWRQAADLAVAGAGLTDASWAPLVRLAEEGDDISQTELASRVGLDTSTLVRLIDILERQSLVKRQVDPDDRRARRIVLTHKGRAEYARIRAHIYEIELRLLEGLDDRQINASLEKFSLIEDRIKDALAGECPT